MTKEKKEEIIKDLLKWQEKDYYPNSMADIARKHKISRQTLYRILAKYEETI